MSRTIKTTPTHIIAWAAHDVVEHHNHGRGECDLPSAPTLDRVGWLTDDKYNCRWDYSHAFYYTHMFCGCHQCTEHDERRQERRRSRHNAKRDNRQYLKYEA